MLPKLHWSQHVTPEGFGFRFYEEESDVVFHFPSSSCLLQQGDQGASHEVDQRETQLRMLPGAGRAEAGLSELWSTNEPALGRPTYWMGASHVMAILWIWTTHQARPRTAGADPGRLLRRECFETPGLVVFFQKTTWQHHGARSTTSGPGRSP